MSIPLHIELLEPDPIFGLSYGNEEVPIVIDNGSHTCRVGFANQNKPHMMFKNVVLKPRFKKDSILVGNDIPNIEAVRNNIRISFDRNIITQFEIQEYVFDHIFHKLGISSAAVNHPIIINEAVCNPNLCRSQMSELLFEGYGVPKLAYYIDALASYSHEVSLQSHLPDGLLISFGYHTVHFLPILDSNLDFHNAKRINVGGSYCDWFMQRLLQLKYPPHTNHITLSLGEKIFQNFGRLSVNYREEMLSYKDPENLKNITKILQLPCITSVDSSSSLLSQQRRQLQVQRLKEAHKKRQQDRLASEQEQLTRLATIQDLLTHGYNEYCTPKNKSELNAAIKKAFKASDIKSVHHLKERIEHCQNMIKRLDCAIQGRDFQEEEKTEEKSKPPKDNYHLIHILDEDLDPEELKIKRKQLMMKANNERRQRIRALKEEQRRKTLESVKQLENKKGDDFLGWLTSLRFKRQHLIESRIQRKNRKGGSSIGSGGGVAMSKADRKLHQQNKMRQITSQVTSGAGSQNNNESKLSSSDAHGQKLDAADIELKDNDSEESDMEQEQLNTLDSLLAQYDPEFSKDLGGVGLKVDLQEYYQLHLTTEQVRVPELFFHPRLIGCDQAGVAETIACVFNSYSPELQQRLANNIVLTGGASQLPGMQERIAAEVRMIRPYQTYSCVSIVSDPQLGAWLGARDMALHSEFSHFCISRSDYNECGHDYLREHPLSNKYWPVVNSDDS